MNRWRKSRRTASCPVCWLLLTFFFITIRGSAATGAVQGTWWKGNLHTHSLWSDGDFYASSGVRLKEVRRGSDRYEIEIDPEAGVTYTTEFIGTRKGFDRSSKPALDEKGELMPVTRQYSK